VTECNTETIEFTRIDRRQVTADFLGGRLTSDAGILLLREVDRKIRLIDAINDAIPDPRDPGAITHEQRTMLAQRIFSIALGYEDLNDQQTMRTDAALQAAAGVECEEDQPMASPSTLCRLENRVFRKTLVRLSRILVDQFIASYDSPPEEITLDFDATDDRVHGQQEGRFFHGYYRHYCFLPLYVFCGSQPLLAYLRPSKIDGAKHAKAIVKLLVEYLRESWPEVKITIRGDGGFCRWKLMRWCEKHDVCYCLGACRNQVLERHADALMKQAEAEFEKTGEKVRLFGETNYSAKTWDKERRVIIKSERLEQGLNTRFVVTNLPNPPQELYDEVYAMRGDMENRIKEQQLMLFADRTSCHDFLANQFRLLLSTFGYVLLDTLRRDYLKGTELERAQCDTIRLKLFKVAARVRVTVRRVWFHLATSYPYQALFRTLSSRLLLDTS
jgi:hypothetical protein